MLAAQEFKVPRYYNFPTFYNLHTCAGLSDVPVVYNPADGNLLQWMNHMTGLVDTIRPGYCLSVDQKLSIMQLLNKLDLTAMREYPLDCTPKHVCDHSCIRKSSVCADDLDEAAESNLLMHKRRVLCLISTDYLKLCAAVNSDPMLWTSALDEAMPDDCQKLAPPRTDDASSIEEDIFGLDTWILRLD